MSTEKNPLVILAPLKLPPNVVTVSTLQEAERLFGQGRFDPGLFAPVVIYAIPLDQRRLSLKQREQLGGYAGREAFAANRREGV